MYSIKTKLVVAITILIIVLFSAAAYLLIKEKQEELTGDIFFKSTSFSELTAPIIIDNYNLYLAKQGFIYFNREMAGIYDKTQDIDTVNIYDYNGKILYDSITNPFTDYAELFQPCVFLACCIRLHDECNFG